MSNKLGHCAVLGRAWCDNASEVLDEFLAGTVMRATVADWSQANLLDAGLLVAGEADIWYELTFRRESQQSDLVQLSCVLTSEKSLESDYVIVLTMDSGEWPANVDIPCMCANWWIPLADLRSVKNPNRVARPIEIRLEQHSGDTCRSN